MVIGNVQHSGQNDTRGRGNGSSRGNGRGNIECFNCGKRGHYARDCYSKPKGQQQQQQQRGNGVQFGANSIASFDSGFTLPDGTVVGSAQYTGGPAQASAMK